MTLSNFLTEAAVNYKIGSGNPEKMLYDFYVLSFISTINLSPEKSKTTTFGDVGFQGGFLGKADRVKEDIEYAQDVLLPVLREKLTKGLFVSICAEIRHIKDRPQNYANTPLVSSKVFKNYYRNYLLLDKNLPKEFELRNLREPKGATPKAEGYKRSYQAAVKAIKETNSTPYEFVKACQYAFSNMSWSPSYGGKNWANICGGYLLLSDAKTKDQVSVAIDHAYDLEHNTGAALNKVKDFYITDEKGKEDFTWMSDALDLKRDAKSMKKLVDRCSGDMKRLALQAMALSPIDYMKKKTPAPETVMQQTASKVGGEYLEAFNEGAPKKFRTKETKKEKKSDLSEVKVIPEPKHGYSIVFNYQEDDVYYDEYLKTYVYFVKKVPETKSGIIVKLAAITKGTPKEALKKKIDQYNKGDNTYVSVNMDVFNLNPADKVNVYSEDKPSETKANIESKIPTITYTPKDIVNNFGSFDHSKIYFDYNLKTYVEYIEKVAMGAVKVKTIAYTPYTKISDINENLKTYVVPNTLSLYVLSDRDQEKVEKAIAAAIPSKKEEGKVYSGELYDLVKKTPVASLPVGGAKSVTTFKEGEIYYDSKLSTYVKFNPNYGPKEGFNDYKIVILYAATGETEWETLNNKIQIFKKESGKTNAYVANKNDLLSISEYDVKAVKRDVKEKPTETNTNIESDIPTTSIIPDNIWKQLTPAQQSKFSILKNFPDTNYVYLSTKPGLTSGTVCRVLKFEEVQGKIYIEVKPYNYKGDPDPINSVLTSQESNSLYTTDQVMDNFMGAPEYRAPYQKAGEPITYAPMKGDAYYDKAYKQYVKIAGVKSGVKYALPLAKTPFTPIYMRFWWQPYKVDSNNLQYISKEPMEFLVKNNFNISNKEEEAPTAAEPNSDVRLKTIPVITVYPEDYHKSIVYGHFEKDETNVTLNERFYDPVTRLVVKPKRAGVYKKNSEMKVEPLIYLNVHDESGAPNDKKTTKFQKEYTVPVESLLLFKLQYWDL
jgi:hypothetical protein